MTRVLMFLLLLGAGVFVLWLVVANDPSGSGGSSSSTGSGGTGSGGAGAAVPHDDGAARSQAPGSIPLPGAGGASFTPGGKFHYPRLRTVPLGDGRSRLEEVFVLDAANSAAAGEGLTRLDGVDVTLFDDGKHVATLTAVQAFVALTRDASGQMSLSEGKEVDLRSAVLTGVEGGKLRGMRLELGDAKVRIDESEVVLTTAPDQPVSMVVTGEQPITLRGKGAIARLPRDSGGSLQRADVEIAQEPVLEMRDTTLHARGPLHYGEDMRNGLAKVTVDDDVVLESTGSALALPGIVPPDGGGGAPRAPAPTTVHGDSFVGWLQRDRERLPDGREHQQLQWRHIELTGTSATVETQGGRLSTARLTAVPGLSGEPFLVTSHGASHFEETGLPADSPRTPANGSAERALHVVRIGEYAGASYRALGFPRWTLAPLATTAVVGEGRSKLTSDRRVVDASKGMRVFRRDDRDAATVQGLGDVSITQRATRPEDHDVVATGNDGFVLHTTNDSQDLRLGTLAPVARNGAGNAFDVRHGDARLVGHGTCNVVRTATDTRAHVVSPTADLVASMPREGLDLQHVHALRARLTGEEVTELEADGWPTELSLQRSKDGEKVDARAPRIVQIGPRSLRLLPAPAGAPAAAWPIGEQDAMPRVRRTARRQQDLAPELVEVRGPQIDVHHAGGNTVLVEANSNGGDLAHIYASVPQRDRGEPTTIACDAERLRLMPFVLTPEVRAFHAGTAGAFAGVLFHSLGRPWLIVDGVHDFQLDDAGQGHVDGRGRRVLVSQGGRAALFVGDAATGEPAVVRRVRDGRDVTLRGPRVRVFDSDDVRIDALDTFEDGGTTLLPTMTLHEAGKPDLLSHVRATCRGNIEVRSEAILFGGPVVATGLLPEGGDDPDGIRIDAQELRMLRDAERADGKPRDIGRVLAKDVTAHWKGLDAKGAEMEIDVKKRRCIVSDPRDAVVDLANGFRYLGPRLLVDYETLSVQSLHGRVTKRDDTTDGVR